MMQSQWNSSPKDCGESSTPLIGHMTDSLDTGQTEDDAFNPKPIDPELEDSEQLDMILLDVSLFLLRSNNSMT